MPKPFVAAMSLALAIAFCAFVADIAVAVLLGTVGRFDIRGVAGAAFFAGVGGIIAGAIAGVWLQASIGGNEGKRLHAAAIGAISRGWHGGDVERDRRLVALLLVAVLGLLVEVGLVFVATRALVLGVARPENVALAVAGAQLVAIAAAFLVLPPLWRLAIAMASLLMALPAIGRAFATPLRAAATLVATAFLALAIVMAAQWAFFSHLPWAWILRFGVGVVGGFAVWRTLAKAAMARQVFAVSALVVWLGAGAASAGLSHDAVTARRWMSGGGPMTQLGEAVTLRLLDVDRDGHAAFFGGGDCAPWNPAVHPGATDLPQDAIDQDCDGTPLRIEELVPLVGRRVEGLPETVPTRPPIVLLTVDGLAARHIGAWAGDGAWPKARARTPNIDALAARGVTMLRAFAQGPSTRLSIPALFTSRLDTEIGRPLNGRQPFPISETNFTLAELLGAEGYETVALPPTDYFLPARWNGLLQGFSRVIDGPANRWSNKAPNTAADVVDAAIEEVGKAREKPLFFWVHLYDTHSPHVQPKDERVFGESEIDRYDAEVEHVDRHVGRLLAEIERTLPNALIIFSSDHASAFDAPAHDKKHYGYDLHSGVLHVPLIAAAPWIKPFRSTRLATLLDVVPTLADVLRYDGKGDFRGNSFADLFVAGASSPPVHDIAFHQFYLPERRYQKKPALESMSVRDASLHLIFERASSTYALYRWREDVDEKDDLYEACLDDDRCQPKLLRLRRLLTAMTFAVGEGKQAYERALRGEPAAPDTGVGEEQPADGELKDSEEQDDDDPGGGAGPEDEGAAHAEPSASTETQAADKRSRPDAPRRD